MTNIIYLICEGSFDKQVLGHILPKQNTDVIIESAFGTSNLGALRKHLQEKSTSHKVYVIRDRDYCSLDEAKRSWHEGSTQLIWRRHEIENYLLDDRVIARAFAEVNRSRHFKPKATPLPENTSETLTILQDIARPLLAHHAAQMVCKKLDLAVRLGTMACGDKIPLESEACLNYLKTQLTDRKKNNSDLAEHITAHEVTVENEYHQVFQNVTSPAFLQPDEDGFLYQMGGKELIKALLNKINPVLKKSLSLTDFIDILFEAFKIELNQPNFTLPDDFVTLAQRLQPHSRAQV